MCAGGDQDFLLEVWEAWNRLWGKFEVPGRKGQCIFFLLLPFVIVVAAYTLRGMHTYCAAFLSSWFFNVIAQPVQGLILEGLGQQSGDQKVCQDKETLVARVGVSK